MKIENNLINIKALLVAIDHFKYREGEFISKDLLSQAVEKIKTKDFSTINEKEKDAIIFCLRENIVFIHNYKYPTVSGQQADSNRAIILKELKVLEKYFNN